HGITVCCHNSWWSQLCVHHIKGLRYLTGQCRSTTGLHMRCPFGLQCRRMTYNALFLAVVHSSTQFGPMGHHCNEGTTIVDWAVHHSIGIGVQASSPIFYNKI